jgi:NADH-quinone oxidoreductase subunit E
MSSSNNSIELPSSVHQAINKTLSKFPYGKNQTAIKSALHSAQDHYGWLPPEVLDAIAEVLNVPKIDVYEVATFYTLFHTQEVGTHVLSMCTNVSCLLRGAKELYHKAQQLLHLDDQSQTTSDKRWTLKEVECLAACGQAPAAQINGRYIGPLTENNLEELINNPEKFL